MFKKDGEYCITHSKRIQEKGNWWLGNILEPKPEIPIYYDGTVHYWKEEVDKKKEKVHIESEVKETKVDIPVKKKRGRPKGSKNKKKNEKNMNELTKEEILFLLKDYKIE